jgi:L-threonylcarbamoyladenylate synthase
MHPRHYSPRTRLLLVKNGEVPDQGNGIYLQHQHPPGRSGIAIVQMPSSPAEYAAALYDKLHRADADRYDWIAVDAPPETPDWEAIRDRLGRASA